MRLKISNENKSQFPTIVFGDIANGQHNFEWDEKIGAYCYEPKSQQESDDIIASNWVNLKCAWRVAPVWDGEPGSVPRGTSGQRAAAAATAKIPPFVNPELYAAYPLVDLQALCADAGFTPEGDPQSADNLRRQLHRYYEGRAWAVEEMRRLREQIAADSPTVATAVELKSIVVTAPKVDRAAKARAARSAKAAERRAAKELQPA